MNVSLVEKTFMVEIIHEKPELNRFFNPKQIPMHKTYVVKRL